MHNWVTHNGHILTLTSHTHTHTRVACHWIVDYILVYWRNSCCIISPLGPFSSASCSKMNPSNSNSSKQRCSDPSETWMAVTAKGIYMDRGPQPEKLQLKCTFPSQPPKLAMRMLCQGTLEALPAWQHRDREKCRQQQQPNNQRFEMVRAPALATCDLRGHHLL